MGESMDGFMMVFMMVNDGFHHDFHDDENDVVHTDSWRFPARHGGIEKWLLHFHGKSHLEMDDDWGYLHFRNPPHFFPFS